ncbi:MAG TPA: sensor histidine kinase, partial [Beutenbergiaceae bacterium]|nr:sensor histidine kinase [Beutenbergiaceae bacterium]
LQDELALMQRHAGEVAERARLAREIHDTVAQELSSIRLLTRAALDAPEDPRHTLEQVEDLAARTSREVRDIIAALTPQELQDQALPSAITRVAGRFDDHIDLTVHTEDIPTLPPQHEVALLRTCQSALSNVARHANATRVTVTLTRVGDSIRLDVRDDGIGFDPESGQGYGLRFMRERLTDLGGGLDVESAPNAGTALSAHVPITRVET